MQNGEIDTNFSDFAVFFEREALHDYPYRVSCSFSEAYTKAAKHMTVLSAEIAENTVSPQRISRETERIISYYEELIEENKRRLSRKGLSAERQEDIHKKHEALHLEMDRQIEEIKENMIPKPSTQLAHGITMHIPVIELVCDIVSRSATEQRTFYYECLTKQIFEGLHY